MEPGILKEVLSEALKDALIGMVAIGFMLYAIESMGGSSKTAIQDAERANKAAIIGGMVGLVGGTAVGIVRALL